MLGRARGGSIHPVPPRGCCRVGQMIFARAAELGRTTAPAQAATSPTAADTSIPGAPRWARPHANNRPGGRSPATTCPSRSADQPAGVAPSSAGASSPCRARCAGRSGPALYPVNWRPNTSTTSWSSASCHRSRPDGGLFVSAGLGGSLDEPGDWTLAEATGVLSRLRRCRSGAERPSTIGAPRPARATAPPPTCSAKRNRPTAAASRRSRPPGGPETLAR
jgi:hypothetical protein